MKILTARPHRLLAEVVRRIGEAAGRGEPCMLLVPAQYTLQAEIEIMTRLNLPGSFLIDVLSPGRLQGRVFERAGLPERTMFDERGKCMVLSAILEEEKDSLTVYRAAAASGAPGFTARLSSLIASFKRSGKTADEVAAAAEQMEPGGARDKLLDAARLYAAYELRMAGELADAEDVSREMRLRMARAGVLDGRHVFVYGFDMITPTFAAELVHMAGLCRSLTLAVETDANGAPDGYPLAPVNFSLERLSKLAGENGAAIEREESRSHLDAPDDLQFMERALFALGPKPFDGAPAHVFLRAASGMRQEVHIAAGEMRRLMRAGETQMAVVYPKGSGYGALLASILPMYGLSAYVAKKRPAGAHPLCRFVLSALAAVSSGWRAADVLECAQSGFMGLTGEEADALCAYCEGADVRGEALKKPFRYARGVTEEELAQLEISRAKIAAPLLVLQKALKAAQNADDTVVAIVRLLEDVGAFDTLGDMRLTLCEAGLDDEAQDSAQLGTR